MQRKKHFYKFIQTSYKLVNQWCRKKYYNIGIVLWIVLLISLFVNIVFKKSITHTFECWFSQNLLLPSLFNVESIKNVVETIGISSILLAWLYASLDKLEIGIRYIDILRKKYRHFIKCTFSHIIAVLLCIWSCYSGALELSLLSLIVILWGSIIHWKAIKNIIIYSSSRNLMAISIWKQELNDAYKDNSSANSLLQKVNKIIATIDPLDEHFVVTSELILLSMNYTYKKSIDEKRNPIISLTEIWDCLLSNKSENERFTISRIVLKKLSEELVNQDSHINFTIVGAYVLWLCKSNCFNDKSEFNKLQPYIESLGVEIKSTFEYLYKKEDESFSPSISLLTFFWYVLWLNFLSGQITLSQLFIAEKFNFASKTCKITKKLFAETCEYFTGSLPIEFKSNIKCAAKNQVNKMLDVSCPGGNI